ncbi:MAG: tRNA pseudouridine(38-40) synthase TruA [Gammaproteobacteria bacterium]|nr:tRNA pseudouridine(38-40) synthase TruA [Gammaproteobacteria bacterium]MCZ6723313.1 tRNA pseudouridine(38-40) synthase TruA [Gammaproteobacteria bacterium]MCZ6796850.1 tRNA pseudouridine(38-40) synthase TruA [Gammaproteobacteria bacterium]
MTKFATGIEYSGTAYSGWQRQKHAPSIQQHVEDAIGYVADHRVQLVCAGRTDAGVHALEQVAHFETTAQRDERAWLLGSNSRLPGDIRIKWVLAVNDSFHARFSAIARSYRYIILNSPVASALLHDRASWEYRPLNHQTMHEAAQVLLGEHDFSAFRAAGCQAKSASRCIQNIELQRQDDLIYLDIKANAFLYHMVRNITGSLMAVGRGERSIEWFSSVFSSKDRNMAEVTAPATGLYFLRAHYPDQIKFPNQAKKPVLF